VSEAATVSLTAIGLPGGTRRERGRWRDRAHADAHGLSGMTMEEEGARMRALFVTAALMGTLALALPADAADLALGEKVYTKRCASCHAPDGRGNAKMAGMLKITIPDLTATAKKDQELHAVISEGKPPMPGFGKQLSGDELQAVVAYTKSLAKGSK